MFPYLHRRFTKDKSLFVAFRTETLVMEQISEDFLVRNFRGVY